jgi:NDP-sugar pyrophosphorylase family protein
MFSYVIGVEDIEASEIFEYLYSKYFYVDFIKNKTYLNKSIYVNPESYKKDEGKELSFWHLTTREKTYTKKEGNRYVKYKERLLDIDRADRLEWVKKIIENHSDSKIKLFYKKETTHKKPIRLYLWVYDEDFVVILQKLGRSSSFLVTSFYITHADKRRDYQKFYEIYCEKKDSNLKDCEWF